jgi:stage III sporulation protein AG
MDMKLMTGKIPQFIGKYKYFLLILLAGVCLMLIPTESKADTTVVEKPSVQQHTVDQKLESVLSNIKGAGKVQVMLTIASGEQIIYQTDTPSADRHDTVIITGQDRGQDGLVQQIISPVYRGAIILCQGADSASVCLAIKDAVSKVTGLDSSQITVLKMK